ncbi:MAG: helix-turn-helix transcriptional regulator [Anaerolineaceae bacterium]
MTRIIFFPDDTRCSICETALSPEEAAAQIREGRACPPIPPGDWSVLVVGTRVVVFPLPTAEPSPPVTLSAREAQVLSGLAQGLTVKQMSLRMGVERRTVFLHLARLKSRLGASTREQCVARAAALGILPTSPL